MIKALKFFTDKRFMAFIIISTIVKIKFPTALPGFALIQYILL
jgi:hypothetical protein